ncbi:hypothetical protein PR202_ga08818 [Eleusine coracana subsp. coracana]|uniref:Uncharacterized protein n=1 Tax=Eleusine coracana subsp. coracana TaxID=191504 RepID=A0AAV5C3L0_ELECO|nr:hypothetical protein PR202_ga08818 [Eleusine coracana subsp. coracana]
MDMWALNLKAGGPCLTPRQTPPATSSPLTAAGEIGSLAVGPTRLWRQPARWPRLVVNASGRKSKNSRGDEDQPKNRASSSGRFFWPSFDAVELDLCDRDWGRVGSWRRLVCEAWSKPQSSAD